VAFAEYFYEFYEKTGALRMTLFHDNRMLAERAFIVCACAARLSCYMEKRKIQRRISENTDRRKIEK